MPEAEARSQQRLAMLHELAEIGMRLARGVERRAEAAEDGQGGDVGLVFSRIARAVRQTLALEARLEEELQTRAKQDQADRDYRRAKAPRSPVETRSRLVRRAVARAIDDETAEQLIENLDERLCDREADDDFMDRPMGELVALICKELGVSADLTLWGDEAWAMEEAAAPARPPSGAAPQAEPACEPPPAAHAMAAGAPSWLSG